MGSKSLIGGIFLVLVIAVATGAWLDRSIDVPYIGKGSEVDYGARAGSSKFRVGT